MTSKEALEIIKRNIKPQPMMDLTFDARKTLEQLVERDTPMKPEKDKDGDDVCPTCGLGFIVAHYDLASVLHDFCPDCGQRLDWSE